MAFVGRSRNNSWMNAVPHLETGRPEGGTGLWGNQDVYYVRVKSKTAS